jgi:hypothetical protein
MLLFGKALQFGTAWLGTLDRLTKGMRWPADKKRCPMCENAADANDHLLFDCVAEGAVLARDKWMRAVRKVIQRARGLPDTFREALLRIFDTNDEGRLVMWDIEPLDLMRFHEDEWEDARELNLGWILPVEETLRYLQSETDGRMIYRGWLPRHWQLAMEGFGMNPAAAEALLGRIDRAIFSNWHPLGRLYESVCLEKAETDADMAKIHKEHKERKQKMTKANQKATRDIMALRARDVAKQAPLPADWKSWKTHRKTAWIRKYGSVIRARCPAKNRDESGAGRAAGQSQLFPLWERSSDNTSTSDTRRQTQLWRSSDT